MEINDHPAIHNGHCSICGSELCWICVEDLYIRSLQHKANFVNWIRVNFFGREVSICGKETCRTALHELNAKNLKVGCWLGVHGQGEGRPAA